VIFLDQFPQLILADATEGYCKFGLIIQAAHCQQLKAKLRDAVQHAIKGRLV
jgi:hypothetical protein